VVADLELSKQLIAKLDEEKGITDNSIIPAPGISFSLGKAKSCAF
jgi:hypothetical protein